VVASPVVRHDRGDREVDPTPTVLVFFREPGAARVGLDDGVAHVPGETRVA